MLGKKFDTLCTIVAILSLAVLAISPAFNDNVALNRLIAAFIFFVVVFLSFSQAMFARTSIGTVEGLDKDKGVNDDVSLFIKRSLNDRSEISSDVVITTLSADSKREIENLLEKFEKLTSEKESVVVRLIAPLLFALISVALYLELSTENLRGPLAITIAFVSTFSFFHCFTRVLLNGALVSKSKAIGKIAVKNQYFRDSDGSTKIIKPYIFEYDYREEEVHPLDAEKHKWDLYLFLDRLRTRVSKPEVDEILKDFVLVENSDTSEPEKAKTRYNLLGQLNDLYEQAGENWPYDGHIAQRKQMMSSLGY